MRRKLILSAALTTVLFLLGTAVTLMNLRTIVSVGDVREEKTQLQHRYYAARVYLQEAQKLLFKHQAGYEPEIDTLVQDVELFDAEIGTIQHYYATPADPSRCQRCHPALEHFLNRVRTDLVRIQDRAEQYKSRVSMMLTTGDAEQRYRLERQTSDLGGQISALLEAKSEAMDRMVAETVVLNTALSGRAQRIIVVTTLGTLLCLLAVLFLTIPAVTSGINALIRGTEAVAAGNLAERVTVGTRDEVGLLAARFNAMADTLQEREGQLRELNQTLEEKVAVRTGELEYSNRKLRQTAAHLEKANRELAEVDRLKSDFITIASHELRTPLVTITGYIDLLREGIAGELTAAQREMIDVAWKSSRRLSRLVRDILDISRIESRKLALKRQPQHVEGLLDEAIGDQRPFADQRGQRILLRLPEEVPAVSGDHHMLVQVFINLINNAIKFTPNGGEIIVTAECKSTERVLAETRASEFFTAQGCAIDESADSYLEVVVADTGVGVPFAEQKRIFEKFYEVGDVRSHSSGEFKFMGGGIGLGLSICKGFVNEHGGQIWVESEGKDPNDCPGSRFHVLLPIQGAAQAVFPPPEVPAPAATFRPPPLASPAARRSILVIDDEPDILHLMEVCLADRYTVLTAASGTEGLAVARKLTPDLVFLDVLMDDVDGYEVCRRLKSDPLTQRLPVILFTAKAQQSEIEAGLRSGADDYLIKPFDVEDLHAKIERALHISRG